MKILIDINHPAHVHFFRNPLKIFRERGHDVMVTSRDKEVAVPLLDELGIEHAVLSSQRGGGGILALGRELASRDLALFKVVRKFRPDAMAAIGGTFIAHVGAVTGVPAIVFYDTENAKLQNAITYPFATKVVVPRCYQAWTPRRNMRYAGYHELSYLHPARFEAGRSIAEANGYDPERDNFFVRVVSWNANHDIGERGWGEKLLSEVVQYLAQRGKVHLSAEGKLPPALAAFAYRGRVSEVHHLMAFCRLFVGESATMASECAVQGVPAIYAANTGRGYTDEQEERYGLVANLRDLDWDAIRGKMDDMLGQPAGYWAAKRAALLEDTIDVAAFVADTVEASGRTK